MSVHPGSEWIDQNWASLLRPYTRWVATNANGLIVDAGSYLELIYKLGERPIKLSEITIAVIYPDPVQSGKAQGGYGQTGIVQ